MTDLTFWQAVGIWAEQYHVSISTAVYIATIQLLSIAIGPLFWTPLADKYGRVPILMASALGASLWVSPKYLRPFPSKRTLN